MKKVYGDSAFGLQPLKNGFIILKKTDLDDKFAISYKMISFADNSMSSVTKDIYQSAKYGEIFYRNIEKTVANHVLCKAAKLDDSHLFIVSPEGEAMVLNTAGEIAWSGTMKYRDHAPADLAVYKNSLWASFPDSNSIIRFNTRTMREELRVGGANESTFGRPAGLWLDSIKNTMLVCNELSHNIVEVDLRSYSVSEYENFSEPVHQYIKVGAFEIVWLDSGVYRL